MHVLYQYKNWDFKTSIYNDWTKVREGEGNPAFPENIDIKITNYCNLWCAFCHENSTISGQHWDLKKLLFHIKKLPKWVEFAIGWGNPLEHPDLIGFLRELKSSGYIPNLTVNIAHIHMLTDNILENIYGLWISYNNWIPESITPEFYEHMVIHTIAGVNTTEQIEELLERWFKVLILWYKNYWRWLKYYSPTVEGKIANLEMNIHRLLSKGFLSFDNLALEQLKIKKYFSQETWDERYMGDEGSFTMYLDASSMPIKYGIASSLPKRWKLKNIFLAFKHIRNESKKLSVWN